MEDVVPRDLAEIRLSYKNKIKASERPKVTNSREACRLLMKKWNPEKIELVEEFKILLLNRSNQVIPVFVLVTAKCTLTVQKNNKRITTARVQKICRIYRPVN